MAPTPNLACMGVCPVTPKVADKPGSMFNETHSWSPLGLAPMLEVSESLPL